MHAYTNENSVFDKSGNVKQSKGFVQCSVGISVIDMSCYCCVFAGRVVGHQRSHRLLFRNDKVVSIEGCGVETIDLFGHQGVEFVGR